MLGVSAMIVVCLSLIKRVAGRYWMIWFKRPANTLWFSYTAGMDAVN
jgi:hypothetical protein